MPSAGCRFRQAQVASRPRTPLRMTRLKVRLSENSARKTRSPLLNSSVCRRRFFMRRLLLSLLVLTFTLPALAQAKHPFTFEDMMKLKRVGEPVPVARRQVGDLQRGRRRSRSQHEDAAHLDRAHGGWSGARNHRRSGRRPPTLGAGWEAVCAFCRRRRQGSQVWIADFDDLRGTVTGGAQAHFDCDRSEWRTLVAGWQEHPVYL